MGYVTISVWALGWMKHTRATESHQWQQQVSCVCIDCGVPPRSHIAIHGTYLTLHAFLMKPESLLICHFAAGHPYWVSGLPQLESWLFPG